MRVLVQIFHYLDGLGLLVGEERTLLGKSLGLVPQSDEDDPQPGRGGQEFRATHRAWRVPQGALSRAEQLDECPPPHPRRNKGARARQAQSEAEALEAWAALRQPDWAEVLRPIRPIVPADLVRTDDLTRLGSALEAQPLWAVAADLDSRDTFDRWWQILLFDEPLAFLATGCGPGAQALRAMLSVAGTPSAGHASAYRWVLRNPALGWLYQVFRVRNRLRTAFARALLSEPSRLFRWVSRGPDISPVPALVLAWHALRLVDGPENPRFLVGRQGRSGGHSAGVEPSVPLLPSLDQGRRALVFPFPGTWHQTHWQAAACLAPLDRLAHLSVPPASEGGPVWPLELPAAWLGGRVHELIYRCWSQLP